MPRNQAGQTGKRAMRRNLAASIPPAVGVALFGISLWVLYHEIERYHYREIAQEFTLSVKTIESHRQTIKHKLGLATNSQLLQYAMKWFSGGTQRS